MSHKAQAVVLACMDFRFRKAVQNFLETDLGLHDVDLKTDGGGVKMLLENGAVNEWICKNFEIAFELHGVERIILINHTDCGAYGGSKRHESEQAEKSFHENELRKAVELLKNKYPDKQVKAYLAILADPISFNQVV